jgi:MFS family permease
VTGWRRLLVEPRRPAAIREHRLAVWLAVATVCVGAFIGQLDASIVTVALPAMRADLHTSFGAASWISLAYLVTLVGTITAFGRLADMTGRKLMYSYGFALFTLASLGAAMAPNLPVLVAMRVAQALGAAMLQANSVALIATIVPTDRLSRALGLQGAAQAIGLCLGPALGGVLLSVGGWRWVFLATVPAGLLGLALGLLLLPRTRQRAPRAPFDWPGLAAMLPAAVATLVALSLIGTGASPVTMAAAIAVAVVAAAAFVRREATARDPMVDLNLVRRRVVATGLGAGTLVSLVLFGELLAVPLRAGQAGTAEHALPTAALTALLTLLPLGIGLTAPVAGSLANRFGPTTVALAGPGLAALGLGLAALGEASGRAASPAASIGLTALGLTCAGAGLGVFTPLNNTAVMRQVAPSESGMASGLLNMCRGLGTALGVALAGLTFSLGGYPLTLAVLAGAAALAAVLAAAGGRGGRPRPGAPARSAPVRSDLI